MAKIAIILFADTDTPEAWGRVGDALVTVREADQAGDEVELIFDGPGTKWVAAMAAPDHKHHRLFDMLRHRTGGACTYCARAYGIEEAVREAGIPLLDEYKKHPRLRSRIADGASVVTF